jgi:hypothetical protein
MRRRRLKSDEALVRHRWSFGSTGDRDPADTTSGPELNTTLIMPFTQDDEPPSVKDEPSIIAQAAALDLLRYIKSHIASGDRLFSIEQLAAHLPNKRIVHSYWQQNKDDIQNKYQEQLDLANQHAKTKQMWQAFQVGAKIGIAISCVAISALIAQHTSIAKLPMVLATTGLTFLASEELLRHSTTKRLNLETLGSRLVCGFAAGLAATFPATAALAYTTNQPLNSSLEAKALATMASAEGIIVMSTIIAGLIGRLTYQDATIIAR